MLCFFFDLLEQVVLKGLLELFGKIICVYIFLELFGEFEAGVALECFADLEEELALLAIECLVVEVFGHNVVFIDVITRGRWSRIDCITRARRSRRIGCSKLAVFVDSVCTVVYEELAVQVKLHHVLVLYTFS